MQTLYISIGRALHTGSRNENNIGAVPGAKSKDIMRHLAEYTKLCTAVLPAMFISTAMLVSRDTTMKLLGAATGSPYIVFISTSGMLRSSDIYIYI